ncbi:hypothetical protein PVAP13_1NG305138 [Panicum virgatum]|uniref:Uncharacterized protein n=1 Tax=Panicum virgatum TaxID=38727 RepID=A0A8T0WV13_PANVG|nr:hypothetical protein PVAP13_1NG305138 [Panicum virgatum]
MAIHVGSDVDRAVHITNGAVNCHPSAVCSVLTSCSRRRRRRRRCYRIPFHRPSDSASSLPHPSNLYLYSPSSPQSPSRGDISATAGTNCFSHAMAQCSDSSASSRRMVEQQLPMLMCLEYN